MALLRKFVRRLSGMVLESHWTTVALYKGLSNLYLMVDPAVGDLRTSI